MKKTRLNRIIKASGAKMVEFAGWEMPVEFSGIIKEHLAVRERVGIFDVSHMGEIKITGSQALEFIQCITSNDASKLSIGKVQYSSLTLPNGCPVDDLLVYKIDDKEFMLVVNAANTDKDSNWIMKNKGKFDVEVRNESDSWNQLAIQGPKSEEILQKIVETDLSKIKYYWFEKTKIFEKDCIISRTGYTGEDGFEVYFKEDVEYAEKIWSLILQNGKEHDIQPCGLGARDTLRLEARMCLYGNDIDETTTLLEADLEWIIKFEKGYFIGKDALLKQKEEGIKRKLVGFEVMDKMIARPHHPVYVDNTQISQVNSGSYAPYLKKNIGLLYLPVKFTQVGTEFEILIRDRKVKAIVVQTPFYKRKK
ncbi:MAG: glycine cleavage system aminomethyltransferase GcvT [Acidobacteriota bacterium]